MRHLITVGRVVIFWVVGSKQIKIVTSLSIFFSLTSSSVGLQQKILQPNHGGKFSSLNKYCFLSSMSIEEEYELHGVNGVEYACFAKIKNS